MKILIRSTNRVRGSLGRSALLIASLLIGCFAVLQKAQAVSPAPDGGYAGGNTAEGQNALLNLTTGGFNTAVGFLSLRSDTTGQFNTAVGAGTLLANTADQNTATGAGALLSNINGTSNTADGAFALFSNMTGPANTANGASALFNNTHGDSNTAVGQAALYHNTTGGGNTAVGLNALYQNDIGGGNTACGIAALESNSSFGPSGAGDNTAIGYFALSGNTLGSGNIAVGANAGSNVATASGLICIGHPGADVSNTTWISNIYGVTTQSGTTAPVIVSDGGQLGTVASSERFKKDIVSMDKASEVILSLRPVAFHYKSDAKETPQFGLIAEEVAKVNPALVLPDKEGKPYSVRYDSVNAMLLNEFLKAHQKMEEQGATIAKQQKQIETLTSGLEKVNAQLEASKPTPQVVAK